MHRGCGPLPAYRPDMLRCNGEPPDAVKLDSGGLFPFLAVCADSFFATCRFDRLNLPSNLSNQRLTNRANPGNLAVTELGLYNMLYKFRNCGKPRDFSAKKSVTTPEKVAKTAGKVAKMEPAKEGGGVQKVAKEWQRWIFAEIFQETATPAKCLLGLALEVVPRLGLEPRTN